MIWLELATFAWLSASLIAFGLALFPIYTASNTELAQILQRGAALLTLLSAVIASLLHVLELSAPLAEVFATAIGHTWLAQIALAVILAITPSRAPAWFAALLAALNLGGFALVSHANAIAGISGAAIQALHLLAAGGWLGGLIALACALREGPAAQTIRRFSRAGLVFVLTLAATGAVVLFTDTGAALPMRATSYGQIATLKIALFAAALALAGLNRFFATPRSAWRLMARVISGELALLLATVCAAVFLAQTEPYG